jgi:hypothetical protein
MRPHDHTRLRQLRIARIAVGASTARGQARSGTVAAARQFLGNLDLSRVPTRSPERFARWHDVTTEQLRRALPGRSPPWGAARKFLNIFLRDALYDAQLKRAFTLNSIERWLEVPLDGDVGRRLNTEPEGAALQRWRTIKGLTPTVSAQFQAVAAVVAAREGCARVHLDLLFWSGIDGKPRAKR